MSLDLGKNAEGRSMGNRPLALAVAVAAAVVLALPGSASAGRANTAALQVALRAMHLYHGGVDGVAGPATRRAVQRFQRRRRLAVDGVVGPRTRRALGRRGRPRFGSRPMRVGQRGWDVAALQFLLARRGFSPGSVDGGFGPGTAAAVQRLQRARGLVGDGVAGPATLRALRHPRRVSAPVGGPVAFLRPVRGRMGDGFGYPGGRRHDGLDFIAPAGAPVGAAGRGVVVFAGWNTGGYGNLVVIKHRLGFATWYAHLSRVVTSPGQSVVGGTRIGYVGSTGHATGPHLHFEVRLHGTPIDPVPRLLSATAAIASEPPGCLERDPAGDDRPDPPVSNRPATARLSACRPSG
jgi:peptidoglycan hydrolase-like protein with peptidoglycan-binding domain